MKKIHLMAITAFLLGCGGSLSDEQRKKLHEGMEDQKIIRVSDSEIVTASLEYGRVIYAAMENIKFDAARIDSIERHYHVNINLLKPGSSNALEVENQLIEAYVAGAETGSIQDNIYSRPKVSPLPDGAVKVEGIWNIHLAKKDVVRSLAE
jgi:hypothetical protein